MGGALGGLFGGSSPTSSSGYSASIPGQANADQQWQNTLAQLQQANPYAPLLNQVGEYSNALVQTPYYQQAQTDAGTAASTAATAGAGLSAMAPQYNNEAQSLSPYITQILQQSLDPQQALYNQQLQQNTDQSNVLNAQYGLTGQQAAGNAQQANQNFNMNWQNQQLSRALQGIQGASTGYGAQTGLGGAAAAAGQTGSALQLAGGTTPSSQYTTNINDILQALSSQAGFGAGNTQQLSNIMSQIVPYLNYGNGATAASTGAANTNQAGLASAATGLGGVANYLSGGSNPFSGLSSFFGGGNSGLTLANTGATDYTDYSALSQSLGSDDSIASLFAAAA